MNSERYIVRGLKPLAASFLKVVILLVFASTLGRTAYAVNIEATDTKTEADGVRYYFQVNWGGLDNAPSWCKNDNASLTCSLRLIGVDKETKMIMIYFPEKSEWNYLPLSNTMSELLKELQKKGFSSPFTSHVFVKKGTQVKPFCLTFARSFVSSSGGQVLPIPEAPCTEPKPSNIQCDVADGKSEIDYGELLDTNIDNKEAMMSLNVSCSGMMKGAIRVKLNAATNAVMLRDDGNDSLYSIIEVASGLSSGWANPSQGEGVLMEAPSATFQVLIRSRLKALSGKVKPGPFSGSFVLVFNHS
ncbi:hypothetical protein ACIOWK_29985 [Pseudomonas protegens]|uniref:MrpH family fimbial adhesin n=1 Tax=Pseudomonas protegens TaxID=380021 RepID=UPI0037F543DB